MCRPNCTTTTGFQLEKLRLRDLSSRSVHWCRAAPGFSGLTAGPSMQAPLEGARSGWGEERLHQGPP